MSNKIDQLPPQALTRAVGTPAAAGGAGREQGSVKATAATDTLQLSGNAINLQQLEQTVKSAPVEDSARVEAVRDALAKGTYQIDAQSIANGLIQAERSLRA